MIAIRPWLIVGICAALAACASEGNLHKPAFDEPLPQAIATAKTAEDHQALAMHFEQEAKAQQAKSAEHVTMADSYEPFSRGPKASAWAPVMAKHCRTLVETYRASAKENRALARLHRKMAQKLSP